MFIKKSLAVFLSIGLVVATAFACDDDNDNSSENSSEKYCKDKEDGANCSETLSWCFCYKGKATKADEIMCQVFPCDEACKDKKTAESCGDGKICDPGGSCIEPKDY